MRLFLAIDIPEEIKEKIEPIRKEFEGKQWAKAVERENLHITLRFFGNVAPNEIIKKLESINIEKFEVLLKGVGVFPNRNFVRVVWIDCKVENEEILEGTLKNLFGGEQHLHLTVARIKRKPSKELEEILKKWSGKEFGRFVVEEIKLKNSTLTPQGPIYKDVFIKKLL